MREIPVPTKFSLVNVDMHESENYRLAVPGVCSGGQDCSSDSQATIPSAPVHYEGSTESQLFRMGFKRSVIMAWTG